MAANDATFYRASWGTALKIMTAFFGLLFVIIVAVVYSPLGPRTAGVRAWTLGVPALVAAVSAFYTVRGYTLKGRTLGVRRLGWTKTFDLTTLVSAEPDPEALSKSVRIFGNGGLFSFTGWFRNKKLGMYRAYVTEAKRAVVLRFSKKTIVVSPDEPERFAAAVNAQLRQP